MSSEDCDAGNGLPDATLWTNTNGFDTHAFQDFRNGETEDKLEPVAIIGYALKFPLASSPESFWKMLTDRKCAMTEWPKDRANLDAFYHPDNTRPGTVPFKGGHFLEEPVDKFDAPFFSIASAEATAMDPMQRLTLETAYRALENAGISLEKASGSKTSVHTGCFTDDYKMNMFRDMESLPTYCSTGVAYSMLGARLSYFFNFTGPCVNIDSACSSSMMAFDLACQGLQSGTANMAMVAGTNLLTGLDTAFTLSLMNFFSKDSRSYSFDHRANGYGRGEGVGVILLKRLSDALKDGDTIRAVVRSTASNQDGHTSGITQPSRDAQEELIRYTYERAGLDMKTTRFVEAHGTGTKVGDPIEATAIGRAFRKCRKSGEPIYIGAVKSNIGHLEGASGIAGLIKTIMVLETGIIPPNANFERLNPDIDAEFLNIEFPVHNTPWPNKGLRRASISSFGFGGSNTHVVMDDAYNFLRLRGLKGNHCTASGSISTGGLMRLPNPSALLPTKLFSSEPENMLPKLLVWSTADKSGLSRIASLYSTWSAEITSTISEKEAEECLQNLAYTLACRRSSLNWKAFAVVNSLTELQALSSKLSRPIRYNHAPRLGCIFTGQGAQFAKMGTELLAFHEFRNSIRKSERFLREFGCQWSLTGEIMKDKSVSRIGNAEYSQVLCTALQIALVDLFRTFNVTPSAVIGHSSGEIAAAYCANALSHRSACKVAFYRGQCSARLSATSKVRGAMISAGLSEDQAVYYLEQLTRKGSVVVACINGPDNVTLSGDEDQVDLLKSLLDGDQVFARKLQVNIAYHSPHMADIAAEYLQEMGTLESGQRTDKGPVMISSVTGDRIAIEAVQQPDYWVQNLTSPVRFADALTKICSSNSAKSKKLGSTASILQVTNLLEIGPHSALQGPTKSVLKKLQVEISYNSTLVRSISALDTFLDACGFLHCSGYPIDIPKINRSSKESEKIMSLPNLPEYPFDHSRSYWHDTRLGKSGIMRQFGRLDLLGTPAADWNPLEARWRNFLRVKELPWIKDHQIAGSVVYPAAGMIAMALEAAQQLSDKSRTISGYIAKDIVFQSPIPILTTPEGIETEICLRPFSSPDKDIIKFEFRIYAYANNHWDENCKGFVQVNYTTPITDVDAGKEAVAIQAYYSQIYESGLRNCEGTISAKDAYQYFSNIGLSYGPAFQSLDGIHYSLDNIPDHLAIGKIHAFEWIETDSSFPQPHIIHPTTFDGFLQLMLVALSRGAKEKIPTFMPTRLGKLWISGTGFSHPATKVANAYGHTVFPGSRRSTGFLFALDESSGKLIMSIDGMEATVVSTQIDENQNEERRLCYNIAWKPDLNLMNQDQVLLYCESARPSCASTADFYEDINYLLLIFISDALAGLEKSESCQSPHLQKYIQWLKVQYVRFVNFQLPHLSPTHSKWLSLIRDRDYRENICKKIDMTNQGKFFIRLGENLFGMLVGKIDPLSFMFEDDHVPAFYKEVNTNVLCWEPLTRFIETLSHNNPGFKIIEIGAGTGSSTDLFLKALKSSEKDSLNCFRYDFTDISPAFFESASERFKNYSATLTFSVLDIEKSPSVQGFEAGTYDIVFAASVLHATSNLTTTLRNARTLLKPGGRLILLEITQDVLRARFAFGLLPGWWLSQEDFRQQGACISTKEWHDLLCQNGFSGVDLEFADNSEKASREYSFIVSTATKQTLEVGSPRLSDLISFPKTVIIVTKLAEVEGDLAKTLKHLLLATNSSDDCEIVTFEEVATISDLDKRFCFSLAEIASPFLSEISDKAFNGLISVLTTVPGILWVTSGGGIKQIDPKFRLIDGVSRVSRSEYNKLIFVTLALENAFVDTEATIFKISRVFQYTMANGTHEDFEPAFTERDGLLEISRLVEANYLNKDLHNKTTTGQSQLQRFGMGLPLALEIGSPGLLDSLRFVEDNTYYQPLAADEIEVKVEATGVNFRDCLTVLGQIDTKLIGGECAGVVTRIGDGACGFRVGDRVTTCFMNTYKTFARGPANFAAKIPDDMPLAEASALPIIFLTAWYSLHHLAQLQEGESILIHAGAGGTGQAAIQVAKHLGAEVFTTVGSDDKKELLMELYGIPENHIFYSRNTTFAQGIKRMTKSRGVDVVLNSLSGDNLVASWECIAPFGRFIEIGKSDINSHASLPMYQFNKCVTFSSVDLYILFKERPAVAYSNFRQVWELIANKKLKIPQPFQAFGIAELEAVLRLFQSGKNSGKMSVEMRQDDLVNCILGVKPGYRFNADSTYVIAGGLGGLGRSAARWMVSRGARNLILLSRSGPVSLSAISFVKELEAEGVNIETSPCDITDLESLKSLLVRCANTMPPIRGCIQGTMVLKDNILEKMTHEDWKVSINPKVHGSWNLHNLLPKGMEFFICLSSTSGIIGGGATANYSAGNTYKDALAEYRISNGEKATSLNLGWMLSEGVVAENDFLRNIINSAEYMMPISQDEFHALLDYYCNPELPFPTPVSGQTVVGLEIPAVLRSKGVAEPHWMQRRTFSHMQQMGKGVKVSNSSQSSVDYAKLLREANSLEESAQIITKGLVRKLGRALSVSEEEIDTSKALHAYGVDSLLAVELRNYFAKEFQADVAVFDISGGASFKDVGMTVARKSILCQAIPVEG